MSQRDYSLRASSQNGPARSLRDVVPDDDADLPQGPTRALFVGGAGTLRVMDAEGSVATIVSGMSQYHPVEVVRVLATGTTADSIVALR